MAEATQHTYGNLIYVIGYAGKISSPNEFFNDVSQDGDDIVLPGINAFIIKFVFNPFASELKEKVRSHSGSWLSKDGGANYPLTFDMFSTSRDIVVAICATEDSNRSIDSVHTQETKQEKENPFGLVLKRLNSHTFESIWETNYTTLDKKDAVINSIKVTQDDDYILVGGTTTGSGLLFGAQSSTLGDKDGFITRLYADNGKPVVNIDTNNTHAMTHTARVASNPYMDDEVTSLCISSSQNAVFAVGSTEGLLVPGKHTYWSTGTSRAFLQKYDYEFMNLVWAIQLGDIGDEHAVRGLDCMSSNDSYGTSLSDIYFLGSSSAFTEIDEGNDRKQLHDNVFLATVDQKNGELSYLKHLQIDVTSQIYSSKDGIVVDEEGNAFLVGIMTYQQMANFFIGKFDQESRIFRLTTNLLHLPNDPRPLDAVGIIFITLATYIISCFVFHILVVMKRREKDDKKELDHSTSNIV